MVRSGTDSRRSKRGRGRYLTLALAVGMMLFGAPQVGSASPTLSPNAHAPDGVDAGVRIKYFFVPNLHPRPFRITPGPDGNLWFTDTDSDLIGRITPDGVITEFPIGDGKVPYDIVAGRDGNLWFTENVNNKVGAVDTSGTLVHEYYAPGADARPTGITVAPNGDLWWVDGGSGAEPENNVSRLTPDGTVTNYELYPCACFGIGITLGPDNRLWAVEELGVFNGEAPGTIDRISLNGRSVVRYPVPAPPFSDQHLPAWDAPGPDGRVWFTEFSRVYHEVGAVTHDGTISQYTLPGAASNTGGVTTGVDGRIWVTEPDTNKVTILNPDGSFVRSLHVHQEPVAITIGPDGNMWFTNALSGEIGRIQTAQPGVTYVLDIAPGFVQPNRTVQLGGTVQWILEAPGFHEVRDATGLGLFGSGLRPPVSFHRHTFTAAGTFGYVDGATGDAGSIAVPMRAPATAVAGLPASLAWATGAAGAGRVFDVQVRLPGSAVWHAWRTGTTDLGGSFVASGPGGFEFRARLRSVDGAASGWSAPVTMSVA